MLCQIYSFASILMFVFSNPLVNSLSATSAHNTSVQHLNQTLNATDYEVSDDLIENNERINDTFVKDLSVSESQAHTWVRSGAKFEPFPKGFNTSESNRNSNFSLKKLFNVFSKNTERQKEVDLGLPPDIAHEYIDTVNPPKVRAPVEIANHHYITSSVAPVAPYVQRLHAGSSIIKTKANYSLPQKSNPIERPRNLDLATLLKAEFDAKKEELDITKSHTIAPDLFALLPGRPENPFHDSNYKTPNRVNSPSPRPYVISSKNVNNFPKNVNQMGQQFVYSEGLPSIRVSVPSNNPTIAITTPNSISFISTSIPTKLVVMRSTTIRPVQYTKLKIKTLSTGSITRPTTTTPPTTSKRPTTLMSNTFAINHNKSTDWSTRVNNQPPDQSSESNESVNTIGDSTDISGRADSGIQSYDSYLNESPVLKNSKNNNKKTLSEDYIESTGNKSDYNEELDYADNSALNPNYTLPDSYGEHPGANYRLTTERLAYILIGSCCALSILCLIVVAMSVRCRDMCDEYRSWKKAEKAALQWQRQQYRLAHHRQDLSRYFRTSVEPNRETNSRPTANGSAGPAPMFGPTCCHCISCSSSWLFRDANKAGRDWCCQRGYYHPAPRGKLPFGAASSVNTFMPRFANNSNTNNCCDEQEGDTDSLNTSDVLDGHHNRHHFNDCPSGNTRSAQTTRRQQLRRIAQPSGNQWIHSSELVDELHKKHSNINNVCRDDTRDHINQNNFRARNRQIGEENIVVWNNNNDERLI